MDFFFCKDQIIDIGLLITHCTHLLLDRILLTGLIIQQNASEFKNSV